MEFNKFQQILIACNYTRRSTATTTKSKKRYCTKFN